MSDSKNVSQAKPKVGGAIYAAPSATTLPTTATGALDPAFKPLGYITEDGITNSSSLTSTEIKAFGGDTVISEMVARGDNFKYGLMEVLNPNVLKEVYGENNVTGDLESGITIKVNSSPMTQHALVIDMILKNSVLKRIVIPNASVTAVDDVAYKTDSAIVYTTTIAATPDADGNSHYEYISAKPASES